MITGEPGSSERLGGAVARVTLDDLRVSEYSPVRIGFRVAITDDGGGSRLRELNPRLAPYQCAVPRIAGSEAG